MDVEWVRFLGAQYFENDPEAVDEPPKIEYSVAFYKPAINVDEINVENVRKLMDFIRSINGEVIAAGAQPLEVSGAVLEIAKSICEVGVRVSSGSLTSIVKSLKKVEHITKIFGKPCITDVGLVFSHSFGLDPFLHQISYSPEHELSLFSWLYSLVRQGYLQKSDYRAIAKIILPCYCGVIRKIIRRFHVNAYREEHDPWEPVFTNFVFGSAEMVGMEGTITVQDTLQALDNDLNTRVLPPGFEVFKYLCSSGEGIRRFLRQENVDWRGVNNSLLRYFIEKVASFTFLSRLPGSCYIHFRSDQREPDA